MSVSPAIRDFVSAVLALGLVAWLAALVAPAVASATTGAEGVSAVLGLGMLLLPIVYKLWVELFAALRFGGPIPVRSLMVSVIAGAAVLAAVSGAAVFAIGWALEQAAVGARGAPAALALVRTGALHVSWLKAGVEMLAALFIGSWIGRRHRRESMTAAVLGFAFLGWALALGVDVLSGLRTTAAVEGAFRALTASLSRGFDAVPAAIATTALPLLVSAFLVGELGAIVSGGRRPTRARGAGQLMLEG